MPLVDVLVESSDDYLTTTEAVKRLLGSTATTSDDTKISALILVASRWAEQYVGFPLRAQKYREIVAGFESRRLLLAYQPIRSVVQLWETTSTDDGTQVETSGFTVNHRAGMLERVQGWQWSVVAKQYLTDTPRAGQEYPEWLADYVAGYTLGGISTDSDLWTTEHGTTSTGRTLPTDIEHAVMTKTADLFNGQEEVVEEAVGDLRVRYGSFGSGQRSDISASLLDHYRRIV